MLSVWEKQSFLKYDHIVIGGGICGLSTALSLKETYPNRSVLVLERAVLPTGASTKNAGFACFGSVTEILSDLKIMSVDDVIQLCLMRRDGLAKLRNRLGDESIRYIPGSYELLRENELHALDEMPSLNRLFQTHFGEDVFQRQDSIIESFGFEKRIIKAVIENKFEGQIDTGCMMRALWEKVQRSGILILSGCRVDSFEESNNKVLVYAKNEYDGSLLAFEAATIGICTNAFTKDLIPTAAIKPGRGQVLLTKEIDGLRLKGIFHMDEGFYYFRNYGNRVLFGGGRNLDFQAEESTAFEFNERIQDDLIRKLRDIILPEDDFEVDYFWTGIMCFGKSKLPIIQPVSQRVFAGYKLSGMGVAIGTELGEQLAHLMTA